jgi:hypothetical protein
MRASRGVYPLGGFSTSRPGDFQHCGDQAIIFVFLRSLSYSAFHAEHVGGALLIGARLGILKLDSRVPLCYKKAGVEMAFLRSLATVISSLHR